MLPGLGEAGIGALPCAGRAGLPLRASRPPLSLGWREGGLWRGPGWNSPHCGPGQEPLASLRGAGDICRDKDQVEAEPNLRVCRALVVVGVGVAIGSLYPPRTEAAES